MDLVEILKDVPKGTKLWSSTFGELELIEVKLGGYQYPIRCKVCYSTSPSEASFTKDGKYMSNFDSECVLFPSRNCRDWGAFQLTKFNPNTLKPFDKVLVRFADDSEWVAAVFSHISNEIGTKDSPIYMAGSGYWNFCIPYNEGTKHLVGTTNNPPLFYRV